MRLVFLYGYEIIIIILIILSMEGVISLHAQILQTTHLNCSLTKQQISDYSDVIQQIHNQLETTNDLTGWLHYPKENHHELLSQIEQVAAEIRQEADVLIVVGVGGSFLGARAILDALTPYFGRQMQGIEVIYVGQNMSGAYINQLLKYIVDKRVYVNVISTINYK